MKKYSFTKVVDALRSAKDIGCKGFHKHNENFFPCKNKKELKSKISKSSEIDELVNSDGSFIKSAIPSRIDSKIASNSTTDQRIARSNITQDPLTRGYRTYYGESVVKEIDMSDAYGYEETKDMNAVDTIKYFIKELGLSKDDAIDRAKQYGKDIDNIHSDFDDDDNYIDKNRLNEKFLTVTELKRLATEKIVSKNNNDDEKIKILKINIMKLKEFMKRNGIHLNVAKRMFEENYE